MKKVSLLVVALFAMFGFMLSASALTEDEVKNSIMAYYNAHADSINAEYGMDKGAAQKAVNDYFKSNDFSADELARIDTAVSSITSISAGTTDLTALSGTAKQTIKNIANGLKADNGNALINISTDKSTGKPVVDIKNADGKSFAKLSNGKFAYTNSSLSIIAVVLSSLVVIGATSRVVKKAL